MTIGLSETILALALTFNIEPKNVIKVPAPYSAVTQNMVSSGVNPLGYEIETNDAIVKIGAIRGGHGTGFFVKIGGKKFMITAAHVCATETVMYSVVGAHAVLYSNPLKDICILSTYQGVETLKWASEPAKGDFIKTIGFPYTYQYDKRVGLVEQIDPTFYALPLDYYGGCALVGGQEFVSDGICVMGVTTYRAAMLVRPGNSGGPALNIWGNVMGIVIASDMKNAGYFVPLSDVMEAIKHARPNLE
jgi:S1-C subfamily serine protease